MAKKNNIFYDSKKEELERKNRFKRPLIKQPKAKKKQSKWNKPLINTRQDKPILKQDKYKKSKWNQPLLKQSTKKPKASPEKQKQLRRLHRFINEAQKRGYEFDDRIIDTSLPAEELAKIKPKDLYKKAAYYDEVSGEIFSGEEGRRLENYRRAQKAKETREKTEELDVLYIELEDTDILDDNITDELDYDLVQSEIVQQEIEDKIENKKEEYKPDTNVEENKQYSRTNNLASMYNEFENIIELIENIPDYAWVEGGKKVGFNYLKQQALDMWNNTVENLTINQKTGELLETGVEKLYNYITNYNVVENINRVYDTIAHSSSQSEIEGSFNSLFQVLNGGRALSTEQAQSVELLNEEYTSYE